MNEAELIKACLSNERLAQRLLLYDRYKRAMYTLAYRLTNDFDDANDVLQDAFLDVFKSLEKFRQEAMLGLRQLLLGKPIKKYKNPNL